MAASTYSVIMAFIWCFVFVLVATSLRHKFGFVQKNGISLILLIMCAGVIRLLVPIEPSFSVIIRSTSIFPALQQYLVEEVHLWGAISVSRSGIILAIWAVGSCLYLLRIGMGLLRLKRYVRALSPEDDSQAIRVMVPIVGDSNAGEKLRIIVSKDVSAPMLVGYFNPIILLPSLSLTDEAMSHVLLHEWTHFQHRHLWIKMVFNVLCALLWWNPLAYIAKADMDHILEVSCDQLVSEALDEPERVRYVESTVSVIKQLYGVRPLPSMSSIGFLASDNESIVERCELVLFPPKRAGRGAKYISLALIIVLVMFSYVFVLQPATPAPAGPGFISITPENSYLFPNDDGTYDLFLDHNFMFVVSVSEMTSRPYTELPIKGVNN